MTWGEGSELWRGGGERGERKKRMEEDNLDSLG